MFESCTLFMIRRGIAMAGNSILWLCFQSLQRSLKALSDRGEDILVVFVQ